MDRRISNFIAFVVTLVWAASFLADIVLASYEPPASIHVVMMIVAGAAFGNTIIKSNGTKRGPDV